MKTVDAFITNQPFEQQLVLKTLRALILASNSAIEEKIAWNVPYYKYYGSLCYLFPQKEGVALSFLKGHVMLDEFGVLEQKGRKLVKSITFATVQEIDEEIVNSLLQEALVLNEFIQ